MPLVSLRYHGRRIVCVIASAVVIAACFMTRSPAAPIGLPQLTTHRQVAAIDSQARTGRDPEAVPTRMALAVPGFGGFAFDTGNGDLIIWVKDLNRAAAARAMVTEYLAKHSRGRGGRAGPNPPVRMQVADFDFLELGSFRDRANELLATERGLRSIGNSLFTNRVEIGVDEAAVRRITAVLDGAAVPRTAVRIMAEPTPSGGSYDPNDPTTFPPRLDVEPRDSLR